MSTIVTVENLHYAYPKLDAEDEWQWVLRGIDLTVEEGEFLSIMGPTGVGKTTFCLALNGIVPQSTGGFIKGNVLVEGLNTKREPIPDLAQRVGLIFQEPETQLFNMSVEAEIAFGLESLGVASAEIFERIEWALDKVGMRGFGRRSPFNLSGGQKQRVAIASILAMTPNMLVLDEPTASLDPLGKTEVFSVVRDLKREQGMTIIMVSHESEHIAEFSDRVIVLNEGRVEIEGTPAEVFAQTERMHAIGLAVPQVSEIAGRLNQQHQTSFAFTQLNEAYQALVGHLGIDDGNAA